MLCGVVVWAFLSQREDKEPEPVAAKEEVWEGEMVIDPLQFEMEQEAKPEPVAEKPAPEPVAVAVADPTPVPEVVAKVPELPKPEPKVETPAPTKALEARMLLGSKAADEKLLLADLEATIKSGEWSAYRDQLQRSVESSAAVLPKDIRGDKLEALLKQPEFYTTLLRWKMLKQFPPILWKNASDSPGFEEFSKHVFADVAVMEEVLMTVQEEDDVLKVLPMMVNLWSVHTDTEKPELSAKYFNLNLACAVVFDQNVSYVNGDSESDSEYSSGVDARTRYDWYVRQNERGYLEVSIDRSPARDLTFVVCAPVTEAELDWAVKEFRSLRRKSWGKTYGEVEYLMERAVDGLDPYESYTLEEILKEGGICGDQTHFCVNTARAAGIPALGLSGMTNRGGHAWAAVKIEDDEWSTKIGRIGGVSQGKGKDPQTGGDINEQDIWMWSSREYRRSSRKLELQRQLWLSELFGVLGKSDLQGVVVKHAERDGEPFPEYWQALYGAMKADPKMAEKPDDSGTLRAYKDFCDALKREFKENPRMASLAHTVEEEHLFPHMDLGDVRRQLDRDRRRQYREAPEQADLITTSLKREAEWIVRKVTEEAEEAEKDEEEKEEALHEARTDISQFYDKSLREYGKSVSGFATMCDDYFSFVKDDEEIAPKAVRDMELAFKRVVDTDSDDWFRAKTEVGLHKRISQMYRQVGEEKKADLMDRRLETQIERARRKAL